MPADARSRNGGRVIESRHNPVIRYVRSLQTRQARSTERAFVVEGLRAISDALSAGAVPSLVLVQQGIDIDLPDHEIRWPVGTERCTVTGSALASASNLVTPPGILAVFPFSQLDQPSGPVLLPLYVIFDQLRDAGNLGTLLRSSCGAGATAAFVTEESVDPFNPKVVRAAMGAHFRLPIHRLTAEWGEQIRATCPLRVLADPGAELSYDMLDWCQPASLVVGSEAHGPSAEMKRMANVLAAIPVAGSLDSLNAAAAGSIMLYEAARQRRRRVAG